MKIYCWLKLILQETPEKNEYLRDRSELVIGIKVFIACKKRVKTTSNKYKKIKVCYCCGQTLFAIFMS